MKPRESNGVKDIHEWRSRFEWIDPSRVSVDGSDLHWKKLTQEDARESFRALERIRPLLNDAEIQSREGAMQSRNRIAALKDGNGIPLFTESDLRFFDLYFGGDHIRVDKVDDSYDVTNGRHRLWLAQREGLKSLPVSVNELVQKESSRSTKEEEGMSNLELGDVEKEAREQHEEADRMKTEIKEHREQVAKLEEALKALRSSGQEIGSDKQRSAEASAEKAKAKAEERLKEIKHDRDEMLLKNKELGGKVIKVLDGRRQAQSKVLTLLAGASGEIRSQMDNMNESLKKDLASLAHAEDDLADARKRLEALDI